MKKPAIYFILFIMAFALLFGVYSLTYSQTKTKLLPAVVCGGMFVLACFQLRNELKEKSKEADNKESHQISGKAGKKSDLRSYIIGFGWIVGLILTIWLVGFTIAIVGFIFFYLLFHGQRWYISLITSAVASIIIYVGFEMILQFRLYEGLIVLMRS